MRNKLILAILAIALSFVSCSDPFDDSSIWDKLNDHESRITSLEELCKQMNTNISSLQSIVVALQNKDFVTSVIPVQKDGAVIGYTITFTNSQPITIYHGENGKDGTNGTNGANGANGEDGKTPLLKIENDYWYVSYDNGATWTELGKAKGEDGTDGTNGTNGANGANGEDGKTPLLKIENDYWCVSYDNGATWSKLGKAKGEDGTNGTNGTNGANGANGANGEDGKTPLLKIENDYWYVSYNNGVSWSVLGKAKGEDGKDGQNGTNGTNGQNGSTPQIGVAKYTDGYYYWTLNGEWLLDANGNKIKAEGSDGKDGQNGENGSNGTNGITPKLKIENDYWYVSYDNGASWSKLGKAKGEDGVNGTNGANGDSMFKSVTQDEGNVYFTLADGTLITLPKCNKSDIEKLLARIQSITYVPKYSDGKATVAKIFGVDEGFVEFDFQISPKDAVKDIAANWQSILSVQAIETATRAISFIDLPIISVEADEAAGVISITATGENIIKYGFYMGVLDMSAALHISDGNNSVISDYIPLVASDVNKRIFYNSHDGQLVVPCNENAFGAKIVSNMIFKKGEQYTASLGVITFDKDVTKIGNDAFNNCDNLVQISINDCIGKIGEYAFANCDMLYFIEFGSKSRLTEIGDYAFYRCPVYDFCMPNSVISVGNNTFSMCTEMTSLTLSERLTTIGNNAFSGCYVDVVLGEDVSKIGDCAFDSITSVYCKATTPPTLGLCPFITEYTTLYVPTDAVDTYKNATGWESYKEKIVGFGFNQTLTIDYTTTDGDTANIKHPFLISNTYSNGVGKATFYGGDIVPASAFSSCYTLKSVTIPQNTKTIGQWAFSYCMNLTEVSIPNSVTMIGAESFKACSGLEAITLPSKLTTIGSYAFDSCRRLTEITIPSGVTSIGDSAFVGCSNLTKVYCKAATPPVIKNQIFGDRYSTNKLTVYVPEQSVDKYNATEFWWDYVIYGYNY